MPVHDWKPVDAGLFHHIHQAWVCELTDALNGGVLPAGHYALIDGEPRGPAVTAADERAAYARRANRVAVRNRLGRVVAVVEIVSPGNKDSGNAVKQFVRKTTELIGRGVNLLLVDLLPPGPRDPLGMYKVVWDEVREEPFDLPADQPLVLAACTGGSSPTAYVESVGVGDVLPPMPLLLDSGEYVNAPLEESYARTWDKLPREAKGLVLHPPAG